jgi:hypothetical protein
LFLDLSNYSLLSVIFDLLNHLQINAGPQQAPPSGVAMGQQPPSQQQQPIKLV